MASSVADRDSGSASTSSAVIWRSEPRINTGALIASPITLSAIENVAVVAPVKVQTIQRWPITATSRITLDVDPTVTPQEVSDRYKQARTELMGSRSRRMSEKHLRLAIFADTHRDGTWEARMLEWNREHPDWRYGESRHFQRDATQATKRLLTPPLRIS